MKDIENASCSWWVRYRQPVVAVPDLTPPPLRRQCRFCAVLPDEREDLERLAQYIIRNPFAVEIMDVSGHCSMRFIGLFCRREAVLSTV